MILLPTLLFCSIVTVIINMLCISLLSASFGKTEREMGVIRRSLPFIRESPLASFVSMSIKEPTSRFHNACVCSQTDSESIRSLMSSSMWIDLGLVLWRELGPSSNREALKEMCRRSVPSEKRCSWISSMDVPNSRVVPSPLF